MNASLDHLLAVVLAVLWPAYEKFWSFPRWLRQLARGIPGIRQRGYREAMAVQWTLVGLLLLGWGLAGRPWPDLGLGWVPGWRGLLGLGLVVVAVILLEVQRQSIKRTPGAGEQVRRAMGTGEPLLPHARAEVPEFLALAMTAGICEEILYRGFFIGYLAAWMPLWAAGLVSSACFGLAHSYLGLRMAARAGAIGVVMAGLYLLTGSLWAPMLLHAGIDVNAGLTGYDVLRQPEGSSPGQGAVTPSSAPGT